MHNKITTVIVLVLILWIILAFLRTVLNISKLFVDDYNLVYLTTEQKNKKVFGYDYVLFSQSSKKLSGSSHVLIFTYDAKPYLYGRYLLYPSKIFLARNAKQFSEKISRDTFFVVLYKLKPEDRSHALSVLHAFQLVSENDNILLFKKYE